MKKAPLLSILLLVFAWTLFAQAPPTARKTVPPKTSAYDTPAQTKAKIAELYGWAYNNSSKESPASSRGEYAVKVLEILKRWAPHRITYEMYTELTTEDQNGNFLPDGWLKFGSLPIELSRSNVGDNEIVVYQWKNPDGSNVIATYSNGHLVSKAQAGLR